jgi:hypothetical protein
MPSRKNKKHRRQSYRDDETSSIEDDLRQQRLRQQQRQEEQAKQEKELEDAKEKIVEEEEIPEPPPQRAQPEQWILKGMKTTTSLQTAAVASTNFPSPIWACLLEQSPLLSSHHRHRLRQVWHAKYLLEHIGINPRAANIYSRKPLKWLDHSLPDGMHCSWDMTCKHQLHPSARTMDVALLEGEELPTTATSVQGGWGVFQPQGRQQQHGFRTLRG